MKRILALALTFMFLLGMTACVQTQTPQETPAASESVGSSASAGSEASETPAGEPVEDNNTPAPEEETEAMENNPGNFNL